MSIRVRQISGESTIPVPIPGLGREIIFTGATLVVMGIVGGGGIFASYILATEGELSKFAAALCGAMFLISAVLLTRKPSGGLYLFEYMFILGSALMSTREFVYSPKQYIKPKKDESLISSQSQWSTLFSRFLPASLSFSSTSAPTKTT